jgi:hypothetical protein
MKDNNVDEESVNLGRKYDKLLEYLHVFFFWLTILFPAKFDSYLLLGHLNHGKSLRW